MRKLISLLAALFFAFNTAPASAQFNGCGAGFCAPVQTGCFIDTSASALFARMSTQPTGTRACLISNTISALKDAGIWQKLDVLHVYAAADAQAASLNWISSSYNAVLTNSPTFTADRGYQGDGTTSYITATGYNPSSGSVNFTLDNATLGAWIRTVSTNAGIDLYMGYSRLGRRNTTTNEYVYRVNDGTSSFGPAALTPGLFVVNRADSANKTLYKNGVSNATSAVASVSNSSTLVVFSAVSSLFSDSQISIIFAGANLSADEQLIMYNTLNAYMVGVGAN